MAETIRIQDCARCDTPPTLTCSADKGAHEYNLAHRCPDGLMARGARGFDRSAVIGQWNSDQVQVALARVQMEAHNQHHE